MELERFIAALVRRWWIIGLVSLLGALIGHAGELSRSDSFRATATIAIAPDRDVFGSETVLNRLVTNEMATIGSNSLRQQAIDGLGERGEMLDRELDLTLQQVPDTDLINISVSSPVEEISIDAANSWAALYVNQARERERGQFGEEVQRASSELEIVRAQRLALDAELRDSITFRRTGVVSTRFENVLRQPLLWDQIVKIDQDIDLLVRQRSNARVRLATVLDSAVVSSAVGPIEAVRAGNGLGLIEGLLIGFSISAAWIGVTSRSRVSLRAINQIGESVWPSTVRLARGRVILPWKKRSIKRDVAAVGTQVLSRLPETRLQVVSFAGADQTRTQDLKAALAEDLESRGYSVSLMGDDTASVESRTVEGMLDLLNAQDSVIFADSVELQSKRFSGRIVTVVAVDEYGDQELDAAQQIAESLELSDSVLTVVAR